MLETPWHYAVAPLVQPLPCTSRGILHLPCTFQAPGQYAILAVPNRPEHPVLCLVGVLCEEHLVYWKLGEDLRRVIQEQRLTTPLKPPQP